MVMFIARQKRNPKPKNLPRPLADDGNRVYAYVTDTTLWHHDPVMERQVDHNYFDDWEGSLQQLTAPGLAMLFGALGGTGEQS